MVKTTTRHVNTRAQGDAHDLTEAAAVAVRDAGVRNGIATIAVIGSTASITTIEFEPGAIADFNAVLESLAPRNGEYRHHLRWGDDNGSSHVRAALLGPSITIPVVDGSLALGTWQQIMLIELDTRGRERNVVIQVLGE